MSVVLVVTPSSWAPDRVAICDRRLHLLHDALEVARDVDGRLARRGPLVVGPLNPSSLDSVPRPVAVPTPRRAATLLAVLLSLVGCAKEAAPRGPLAAPVPRPADDHRPEVLAIVAEIPLAMHWRSEAAEGEPADVLARLAAIGPGAISTLAEAARTTADLPTRDVLLDAIGRIGGDEALRVLERFTQVTDGATRKVALRAIARDAGPRATGMLQQLAVSTDASLRDGALDAVVRQRRVDLLPFLRETRANALPELRLSLLGTMLSLGDAVHQDQDVGEVIQLGLRDEKNRDQAAEILMHHGPLRVALGFPAEVPDAHSSEFYDSNLLLPAADEWYHEQVLHEPSPWRPLAPALGEPHATAKQSAWAVLLDEVKSASDGPTSLRVHPGAQHPADDARLPALVLLTGSHYPHSTELTLHLWRPQATSVVGTLFSYRGANTTVQNGTMRFDDYAAMVAGLRVLLDANLHEWWTDPNWPFTYETSNTTFCVVVRGFDEPDKEPRRFCGYQDSYTETTCIAMRAAWRWYDRYRGDHATLASVDATTEQSAAFAGVFAAEQPVWAGEVWWWVREHMVAMARDVGDASLCEPLRRYLAPSFTAAPYGRGTTAATVDALAALTGTDLRTAADGSPRPLTEVAAAYESLLAERQRAK